MNADPIATGLSGFKPESTSLAAGRIMLRRLKELANARSSPAFETTLASRHFAPWIASLRETGYVAHLIFLWLPSPDLAVLRVEARVKAGGHSVSEEVVRRRYRRGLRNFVLLYREHVDSGVLLDNSSSMGPKSVAIGGAGDQVTIHNVEQWEAILSNAES